LLAPSLSDRHSSHSTPQARPVDAGQVRGAALGATAEIRRTRAPFRVAATRKNFGRQITVALPDIGAVPTAIAETRRFTAAFQTETGSNKRRTSTERQNREYEYKDRLRAVFLF
jgi:hypothetical protein